MTVAVAFSFRISSSVADSDLKISVFVKSASLAGIATQETYPLSSSNSREMVAESFLETLTAMESILAGVPAGS